MGRNKYAPERRSWPTLLRHALRAHLAARGRTIPEGLTISYREPWSGGPASIDVRSSPLPTEQATNMTHVANPVDADGRATEEFIVAASGHADRMRRARARLDALVAAGHDPTRPPRHALEAHPLLALALRLVDAGRAGISGGLQTRNGVMWTPGLTVTAEGVSFTLRDSTTMRLTIEGEWPETMSGGLGGEMLRDVVRMPSLGREAIDAAVRALVVRRGWNADDGKGLVLELEPVPVVSIDDTPPGEDGSWKVMEPVPMDG